MFVIAEQKKKFVIIEFNYMKIFDRNLFREKNNLYCGGIMDNELKISVLTNDNMANIDYESTIFKLQQKIDKMTSNADMLDYFVAVSSGILCSMLDILWVGDFCLANGRKVISDSADKLVIRVAKLFGCKNDEIRKSVAYLETIFPLAADGNTPNFGGGLQHHLRDFAHHPTIVGLIFSLLTQFTEISYGTDVAGNFIAVPVVENSKQYIGTNMIDKIFKGTIIWFFHLISDMAGSKSTAGLSGGTGIPGPILSLAKELSSLPFIKGLKVDGGTLSLFLSKMFNGTLFAKRGDNGKIIEETIVKMDLRGELGALLELGKQAIPVIANECIVRAFYFIRRLFFEIKINDIKNINEFSKIEWEKIKPYKNPTLTRMLTISTGVFTTIDISEAVITKKYFVSVNYIGVGRFTVALGSEMAAFFRVRKVKTIKQMYQDIERNTFNQTDEKIYERIGSDMEMEFDKFGLSIEQTEILYNLELHKTLNDIERTVAHIGKEKIVSLKQEWVDEWKSYMHAGFPNFIGDENAVLHWYSKRDLIEKVKMNHPEKTWFKLVLLEAMLFEPYYPLSTEKDKKGKDIPCRKYKYLGMPLNGYNKREGDKYLEKYFDETFYNSGFIKRLRKCYNRVTMELKEVLKSVIISISVTAGIVIAAVVTCGALAPSIAVLLVGSQFTGLSGAALTSACLAYLGGGAIAAGGLGMAGGTAAIVGGSTLLGLGVGAGVGGTIGAVSIMGEKQVIIQSAKLMVSVREILLNEEHDINYSNTVYEQYVKNITEIEKGLVELKLKADMVSNDEKKKLKQKIKNTEESVQAMKIAMKSMKKFISSYELGASVDK